MVADDALMLSMCTQHGSYVHLLDIGINWYGPIATKIQNYRMTF